MNRTSSTLPTLWLLKKFANMLPDTGIEVSSGHVRLSWWKTIVARYVYPDLELLWKQGTDTDHLDSGNAYYWLAICTDNYIG